jgi:hypothetical protein
MWIVGNVVDPAADNHVDGAVLFSWAKSEAFTLGEGLTHDAKTKNPPQRFLKGALVGLLAEDVGDVQYEVKGQVSTPPQNHKAEEAGRRSWTSICTPCKAWQICHSGRPPWSALASCRRFDGYVAWRIAW